MKIELTRQMVHNEFAKKVELISGQNLFTCYQCGNCTAGCPVAFAMEVGPTHRRPIESKRICGRLQAWSLAYAGLAKGGES